MAVTHGGNIFAVAETNGIAWQQVLDFSASINPLGPSPAAREAILCALDRMVHYPERTSHPLRERLAAEWGVAAQNIIVGNGATELLFDWCRHYPDGSIAAPAFSEFHRAWPKANYFDLTDRDTWPATGPVVITRPANPTGYIAALESVQHYASGRRDAVLVDESFLDFTSAASVANLAIPNLFVLRSLTKFWALPGLRIGALVGNLDAIAAQRPPWPVNALAEAAALASLADREHAQKTRAFVEREREWLRGQLQGLPSEANYLTISTPRAGELVAYAAARNVLIRDCGNWPGWDFEGVRVAVRKRWENEILVQLIQEFACDS
ncbi:pyridoxal phosphate-dependent aminotransferase [Bryobacter aggregatus]|uniref:pyridoxal phosphate-dependent aminotransferase n=1 Tax=Bryobacter aggregatus TaxID=360054 RepID=UPI0004E16797|nr:aminotransferase class I/II-fold pyridoxal phosphate-dependent enzyme [Bryobacter aggregatus]